MRKLKLKLEGKDFLGKEQMKKIGGGGDFFCYAIGTDYWFYMMADNCCAAQGACDGIAWSGAYSPDFPDGCDCPCDMAC